MLIPVSYYGTQLVAMPFAPDYSFVRQVASELGMAGVSTRPAVFNVGKIVGSVPILVAAFGFLRGLTRMKANGIALWLTFLGMIAIALSEIQAGLFPLPDPRHEGFFIIGYPLWSLSFLAAATRIPECRALKGYLIASIALTVLMLTARIALGEPTLSPIAGLFQRIFALVTVVPIGVAAWFLAARWRSVRT